MLYLVASILYGVCVNGLKIVSLSQTQIVIGEGKEKTVRKNFNCALLWQFYSGFCCILIVTAAPRISCFRN